MGTLASDILVNNEKVGTVYTQPPFYRVKTVGDLSDFLLPNSFLMNERGEIKEVTKKNPLDYVAFLYQGITGSYIRASEAYISDDDDLR